MSEMCWIRRACESLGEGLDKTDSSVDGMDGVEHHLTAAANFSYFMDDQDLLTIDEDLVDQFEWPSPDWALILTEAYFHAMQGSFPFVLREPFLQTMAAFPQEQRLPTWSGRRWLSLANLVWAIGSKWLEMTKLMPTESTETHLLYYARARALGLDHRVVFDHPDMERIQGIGLLAFYLLINGSITRYVLQRPRPHSFSNRLRLHRAWNTSGHATRHAIALGLHLRVADPDSSEGDREGRARTFYSLYSLEILLAEILGRPKSIFLSDVTTPLHLVRPTATEEARLRSPSRGLISTDESRRVWLDFLRAGRAIPQAMTGGMLPWTSFSSVGHSPPPSYFPHRLCLCRVSERISKELYSEAPDDSWPELQRKISQLQTELRHELGTLPADLTLVSDVTVDADPRAKIELAMYHHSLQMILHSPCLGEMVVDHQTLASQEFHRSCARACVHAAMSMLAILPDNPTAHEAYRLLPWWALLHYVAQATAVLLLELCLAAQHFDRHETPDLVNYLRKAMAYIWCMSESSLSAYQAWRTFRHVFSEMVQRHEEFNAVDIPDEAPQPAGWTEEHEMLFQQHMAKAGGGMTA
jgi:hypothetical protein